MLASRQRSSIHCPTASSASKYSSVAACTQAGGFPVERHRIANLMIERIDLVHIGEVQGIKVKWRELGWDKLIGEFAPKEIGAELMEVEA